MTPVTIHQGDSPVILGLPHTGAFVPDEIFARLTPRGQTLADTDWHVDRLYDGLLPGATTVRAMFHRYVIDANRGPENESLYPGQNTTGLVPMTDFDGEPLWTTAPDDAEIAQRLADWHTPYHSALAAEIARVKAIHGVAILYDCHSIRSHIPFLFDGTLPDFNIGTNLGVTCDPRLEAAAQKVCSGTARTMAVNGRFKGGWTTRHYGQPGEGVHAIQMELAQSTHLKAEALPFAYDPAKAEALGVPLGAILHALADLAPELGAEA
ncbi:N-formylglutamate deformylase [Pseudodonghicola xiamenensis]|uniref:N-formylglutamate deformylase n=1 Tax=Pseudodonghicola xiamenensis TaxID=337702 RepID=A0A8J3MDL5_9RHOB|nr:N-formylglutamate deformylase [Pseudodonghicola xiamenensis]GHG99709.1 N-formylglutamate deformylase [Pseudodonghicola xiamenensis]